MVGLDKKARSEIQITLQQAVEKAKTVFEAFCSLLYPSPCPTHSPIYQTPAIWRFRRRQGKALPHFIPITVGYIWDLIQDSILLLHQSLHRSPIALIPNQLNKSLRIVCPKVQRRGGRILYGGCRRCLVCFSQTNLNRQTKTLFHQHCQMRILCQSQHSKICSSTKS